MNLLIKEKEKECETKEEEKYYKHHPEANEKQNENNEKEHLLKNEISQINKQNQKDHHIENCIENKIEHYEKEEEFKDPSKLFDFVFTSEKSNSELKTILINEIKSIIDIMQRILYTPPYPILFGRISIARPKEKVESKQEPIDESFYEGFGFDLSIQ